MSDETLPTRSQFLYATLFAHPHAYTLPLAVRFELARIMTHGLHFRFDACDHWRDALYAHLHGAYDAPPVEAPDLPELETVEHRRVLSAPRQVALAAVEICLHPAAAALPDATRAQLWHIVRVRPPRRSAEQNDWVRALWHFLFTHEPMPSRFACVDPVDIAPGDAPPTNTRQLAAEVLTHPDFEAVSEDDRRATLDTARRIVELLVVRVARRRSLARQWRALYTPDAQE